MSSAETTRGWEFMNPFGQDPFSVEGRVVLITGASRNTGANMSRVFAAAGAKVAATGSRITPELEAVVSDIKERAGTAMPVALNLEDTSVETSIKEIETQLGPVDIVINNAAIRSSASLDEISVERWDQVMNINLRGPFLLAQALMPGMIERGFGRIINVAGTDSTDGWPHSLEAAPSKAGLLGLTRALASRAAAAQEHDPSERKWPTLDVTVNAISPGGIAVPVAPGFDVDQDWASRYFARIPAGVRGQMEEFSLAAVFLASPAAGYITGQTINITGGMV